MQQTILITGATDGIGFHTAKMLRSLGHTILLHGRSDKKLANTKASLLEIDSDGNIECYMADLSNMSDVEHLASAVTHNHARLDVLINNAGVYKTSNTLTEQGLDIRFVVNTYAPYLLTHKLSPLLTTDSRVINLSSAAQSPVDLTELNAPSGLLDFDAYAQSKLAITMWSRYWAEANPQGPAIIAVNPGSLLGSKMVKEGFGVEGAPLDIGAKVLTHAALDEGFANASGKYFDNDVGQFAAPHSDALDNAKCAAVVKQIESVLGISLDIV